MLRDLFRLIFDILRSAHYEDVCRGLYLKEDRPKTCGTKIQGGKEE